MRVLLINVNGKYSSTGKIMFSLYNHVNNLNNSCALCYGRGEAFSEENLYKFGIDVETSIHAMLTRITGYTACYSYFSTKRLIKFIKEFKPDIIHISALHAYFVNIKPLINYIKANKIPTVYTFHCDFMYTGRCGIAAKCDKWKTGCGECPYLKVYPKTLFFDKSAKMHREKKKLFSNWDKLQVITPSKWLKNRVEQSFLMERNVLTVANGIDTNIFYKHNSEQLRRQLNLNNSEKVVLVLGSDIMTPNKGGKYALILADMLKNYNIKIIIVGIEKKFDVADNVILVNQVTNPEILANYYSMADIFLLVSQFETFSLTCAEALCCGTAVKGFRCGAPETIYDKKYVDLVNYGDMKSLKENIIEYLDNKLDSNEISAYGKSNFSEEKMVKSYYKIYENIYNKYHD